MDTLIPNYVGGDQAQSDAFPRHFAKRINIAMADTPAILLNGPRQCGKTTLVKRYASHTRPYFTLDDGAVLAAVRNDPLGFVRKLAHHQGVIIDEVQRVPELLLALKYAIDEDRRPGRFLLTGSANVMALPHIADSLAGRIEVLTLLPLSQAEIKRQDNQLLAHARAQTWPELHTSAPIKDFEVQVLAGGYPEMRSRSTPARRQAWARSYLNTLIERDIKDIAQIDQIKQMPQLLRLAAHVSSQMANLTQLGGELGLNAKTVDKYLAILENIYLVKRLPAWHSNAIARLVKTPKLHFLDAGLQATLTRLTPEQLLTERGRFGATLETWVFGELLKAVRLSEEDWQLSHFRDSNQVEVDFVLEDEDRALIGIEVKASAMVNVRDFKGLYKLKEHAKERFQSGVILYTGDHVLPFGEGFWAVPLAKL